MLVVGAGEVKGVDALHHDAAEALPHELHALRQQVVGHDLRHQAIAVREHQRQQRRDDARLAGAHDHLAHAGLVVGEVLQELDDHADLRLAQDEAQQVLEHHEPRVVAILHVIRRRADVLEVVPLGLQRPSHGVGAVLEHMHQRVGFLAREHAGGATSHTQRRYVGHARAVALEAALLRQAAPLLELRLGLHQLQRRGLVLAGAAERKHRGARGIGVVVAAARSLGHCSCDATQGGLVLGQHLQGLQGVEPSAGERGVQHLRRHGERVRVAQLPLRRHVRLHELVQLPDQAVHGDQAPAGVQQPGRRQQHAGHRQQHRLGIGRRQVRVDDAQVSDGSGGQQRAGDEVERQRSTDAGVALQQEVQALRALGGGDALFIGIHLVRCRLQRCHSGGHGGQVTVSEHHQLAAQGREGGQRRGDDLRGLHGERTARA